MLAVKVNSKGAEKTRRYLKKNHLLDNRYKIIRRDSFIYFPISRAPEKLHSKALKKHGATVARHTGTFRVKNAGMKMETMHGASVAIRDIPKSLDILGNIAVMETPGFMAKKLARNVLRSHKNVRTVLLKGSAVRGVHRTRAYRYVAGERSYIAHYKENNCVFVFDIRRVFFSPRLAFERNRIANLVREEENVMVLFAGIGPFAIEIAKRRKNANIIAIEINKYAVSYMKKNIGLNKAYNVMPVLGDAKNSRIIRNYSNFANRIIMPLPKKSINFFNAALKIAGKKCTIHYYCFGELPDPFEKPKEEVMRMVEKTGRKFAIRYMRIVRPYSSTSAEIVLDIELS